MDSFPRFTDDTTKFFMIQLCMLFLCFTRFFFSSFSARIIGTTSCRHYSSVFSHLILFPYYERQQYRDIKPANLLLNKNEKKQMILKISDFGISRAVERPERNQAMTLCGYDHFLSALISLTSLSISFT